MATIATTIAELKFKQAIIKNTGTDAEARLPPVPADVIAQLFSSIHAVLQQNTPTNIQKCTDWIMQHVALSKARIAPLGDYLTALSKSIVADQGAPQAVAKAARNRMDLLRIVNDVLHADKFHPRSSMRHGMFGEVCGSFVAQLIERAAEFMTGKDTQLEKDLIALINYWALNQLASPDCLKLFREKADEALLVAKGGTPVRKRNYLLPEYHGDQKAPWYDLPASYMLEPMIKLRDPRNDSIDPRDIRIQKLDKKPVSPYVRQLLDDFFDNIDLRYRPTADNPTGETAKYKLSLDPSGQLVKRDKETGETTTVANGYGWSMKFCQDLQKYGVPENIKIAREDFKRMENERRRHRRSSSRDTDHGRGEQRHTSSSPSRSRSRHRSASTYHSRRSRSSSRGIAQDRRRSRSPSHSITRDRYLDSPNPMRRSSSDYGRQHGSRSPPRPHHREDSQRGSQRGRPPHPGQFQGRPPVPMPPFDGPPSQPGYQGAGAFMPPRPPTHAGPWSQASNMNASPNGPQYGSQYGINYNNNGPYNQNQGGFQGGRGYGSPQRGGYHSNRGGWRGNARGGRYQG